MKSILISSLIMIVGLWFYHANFGVGGIGTISFPTSLDTLTNPSGTDSTATVSHSGQHSDANDAIEALEAKVGADGSAVTTSHDYKLSGVTGADLACSLTGIETLTNKTLTSPTINTGTLATTTFTGTAGFTLNGSEFSIDFGSDAPGDVFYRDASGDFERLGIGSNGQFMTVSSGIPAWVTNSPVTPTLVSSTTDRYFLATGTTQLVIGSIRADGSGSSKTYSFRTFEDFSTIYSDVYDVGGAGEHEQISFYLATTTGSDQLSLSVEDGTATYTTRWFVTEY